MHRKTTLMYRKLILMHKRLILKYIKAYLKYSKISLRYTKAYLKFIFNAKIIYFSSIKTVLVYRISENRINQFKTTAELLSKY